MAETETGAISTVLEFSVQTSCPVYIVHVSTGEGARLISAAKQSGIKVFAETCPHYLLLDDSRYGAEIPDREVLPCIMSPPLRTTEDQSALWKGLNDGTFDVVATDHCPFNTYGQKDIGLKDFTRIPNGVGGIEYRTRLLYTYGVLQGRISLEKMVYLTSSRPAEIFGLSHSKGRLAPGFDADIVLLNPDFEEIISTKNQVQKCDSNIYEGMTLRGRITIL
jgi:dihydropyrimidinase